MICRSFVALMLLTLAVPVAARSVLVREDTPPPKSGFVTVNGVKLHYLDWGGTGEAILFLAGLGNTAHTFDTLAPKFTDRFHVLGLTRRGHGESDKPESGYDTGTLVEDIRRFLEAMNIKRVNLIGHSMAGDELTRFAALYPKRVDKLIYLDAAVDRSRVPELYAKDPLAPPPPPSNTITAALIKGMTESHPDYTRVKAPALSFYVVYEHHPGLKPDADEATRKKAEAYWGECGKPFDREQIERFRKEVRRGRVIELKDTHHYFYRDPKQQDGVVREMRAFLLNT
jgi:pimeloyl-ACP methyl ester carboxylesterase